MPSKISLRQSRKELIKNFPGLVDAGGPASMQFKVIYDDDNRNMSWSMKLTERLLGERLEKVLSRDRRGSQIARRLGVSPGTILAWRKRLGI